MKPSPLLIADLLGCVRTVIDGDRVRLQVIAPDGSWETHCSAPLADALLVERFQDAVDQFARRTVDQTAVVLGYRNQVVPREPVPAPPLFEGVKAAMDAMASPAKPRNDAPTATPDACPDPQRIAQEIGQQVADRLGQPVLVSVSGCWRPEEA